MVGYFKDHGVTVDSTNLASLQKEAQTATTVEGEEGKLEAPEPELQRQPSKVYLEAVDSDSEPETKPSETHAAGEHTAVTASA